MKITLCGSIAFYDEMLFVKEALEHVGHEVNLPPSEILNEKGDAIPVKEYYTIRKTESEDTTWVWDRKEEAIRAHFDKVAWSDCIVVVNIEKNNIPGYIGANTLLEMGLAFYLKKPIYLFNSIPKLSYTEEILGMKPISINQDLTKIKE